MEKTEEYRNKYRGEKDKERQVLMKREKITE
jgi:hypothetical protein